MILNAANGTVGQLVLQLCHLLRLRGIAVVSGESEFEKTALWLRSLGAAEVLLDQGNLKVSQSDCGAGCGGVGCAVMCLTALRPDSGRHIFCSSSQRCRIEAVLFDADALRPHPLACPRSFRPCASPFLPLTHCPTHHPPFRPSWTKTSSTASPDSPSTAWGALQRSGSARRWLTAG